MESEKTQRVDLIRVLDFVFVGASVLFFICVSGIFLATKFGIAELRMVLGIIVMSLIVPYTVILIGYVKEKPEKAVIIPLGLILFYLFLELIWDYILRIPFRDILGLHIVYIIVFYIASFNMIGVSFRINRTMGFVVTITFWISLGCLIYMYLG
jgi:hypothetical protein